jgi:hypothetical protein
LLPSVPVRQDSLITCIIQWWTDIICHSPINANIPANPWNVLDAAYSINCDARRAYAALQRDLALELTADRETYTDAKAAFIRTALADLGHTAPT